MAWTAYSFPIVKQSDSQILNGLLEAVTGEHLRLASVNIAFENGPSLELHAETIKTDETLQAVLSVEGMLIRQLHAHVEFRARSTHLQFHRDSSQPTDSISIDLRELNRLGVPPNPALFAEISSYAHRLKQKLSALETRGGIGKLLGEDTKLFYERREADLQRIEAVGHSMLEQFSGTITTSRLQLEEEYRVRRTQMEGEFQANQERLQKRFAKRTKDLDGREKLLQERLAAIDDRDVRHARREIRKEQKKELEASSQRFELTPGTVSLRNPIASVCRLLLWFFGIGAMTFTLINAYLAFSSNSLSTAVWVALGLKQAAFTAGLVSTAIFYIRWNNRWFEQHASEEFRLKRLSLDLDRASWLVETAMEWKQEKGTEIPNILVERLSSGLFEPEGPREAPLHPADQLASALLGASAEASLEIPGGSKLRIDRKGLRALQKEPAKGA